MRKSRVFLRGKTILIGFSLALFVTILIVYLTGFSSHRTILENSYISLSILAIFFFGFLTVGLYKGLHVHDDLSHKLKFDWGKTNSSVFSGSPGLTNTDFSFDGGDGLVGILISLVVWILVSILFIIFLALIEIVLSVGFIVLIALIYWIIMRALKLIFSKSNECYENLSKSLKVAAGHTILYLGWIYGIIYLSSLI